MDGIVAGEHNAPGVTVIIAGRPTLFRLGLLGILRERHPDWLLIELDTFHAVERSLLETVPDVLLIDERLPGFIGVDDLRRLRALVPDSKILILADADDREQVLDFIDAGTQGYITTSANPSQVLAAFNAVLCGGVFAPASLIQSAAPAAHRMSLLPSSSTGGLTGRQKDVFDLMAQGCSTKMIARELGLAVGTVKVHLAAIYRLLGAHTRTEAVARIAGLGGGSLAGSVHAAPSAEEPPMLDDLGWSS